MFKLMMLTLAISVGISSFAKNIEFYKVALVSFVIAIIVLMSGKEKK